VDIGYAKNKYAQEDRVVNFSKDKDVVNKPYN